MLKYRYHRYGCLGNFIQSLGIIKSLQQKPSIFFYLPPPEWKSKSKNQNSQCLLRKKDESKDKKPIIFLGKSFSFFGTLLPPFQTPTDTKTN